MKILQFGADVKVTAPEELAKEIWEEIGRMKRVYAKWKNKKPGGKTPPGLSPLERGTVLGPKHQQH